MSDHSPGPWRVESGAVYGRMVGSCIARMDRENHNIPPTERDANAQLIAKAPMMHQLLDDVPTNFLIDVMEGEPIDGSEAVIWLKGFVKRTNEVLNDV